MTSHENMRKHEKRTKHEKNINMIWWGECVCVCVCASVPREEGWLGGTTGYC